MRAKAFIMFGFLLTLLVFVSNTSAQEKVNAGVLNGRAIRLPVPPYSPKAKSAKASGVVSVEVTIDENGDVTSAKAVSGHLLLREISEKAALAAKFQPFVQNGKSVKASGTIVYNFVVAESLAKTNQEQSSTKGSVLNIRALKLPLPQYPDAAKAVKASGAVNVLIKANEKGEVIAAEAISGHPLLRAAAVEAAKQAEILPILVNGKATETVGVLVYNFVAQ